MTTFLPRVPTPRLSQSEVIHASNRFTVNHYWQWGIQQRFGKRTARDDDPHTCYSGHRLSDPSYVSFSERCEAYVDELAWLV